MAKVIKDKRVTDIVPTHIGGPGTCLPRFAESILSWAFAIGCLSVALWHYQIDQYRTRFALRPTKSIVSNKPYRVLIPLTTHSRREWLTVSESYEGLKARYLQLLKLIYSAILIAQAKPPSEEKKDDSEEHSMGNNKYPMVNGKAYEESRTQMEKEEELMMGKVVAKWLRRADDENDILHCRDSHEILVGLVRTNEVARRLTSLLLGEDPIGIHSSSVHNTSIGRNKEKKTRMNKVKWLNRLAFEEPGADIVLQTLQENWPRLLELPADVSRTRQRDIDTKTERTKISVIVPAFREDGEQLGMKLRDSIQHAVEPHRIEIIVVHVVEKDVIYETKNKGYKTMNGNLPCFAEILKQSFSSAMTSTCCGRSGHFGCPDLRILEYHGGGGRGPCLNYGAKYAKGSILTFLHGDTRLVTTGWDNAISKALDEEGNGGTRTTCCAFSFAIDRSREALTVRRKKMVLGGAEESEHEELNCCHLQYCPPGLRAIEYTANLRCKFFSLPYGDQCLSLPTTVFRHVGGYPDQCLMEDYELVRLLRMRSAVGLGSGTRIFCSNQVKEGIEVLSDYKALCSPRRWQNYGVLYVTYTNSYCVSRYNAGEVTPDELFCEYYRITTPPNRTSGEKSPWEAEIQSYDH